MVFKPSLISSTLFISSSVSVLSQKDKLFSSITSIYPRNIKLKFLNKSDALKQSLINPFEMKPPLILVFISSKYSCSKRIIKNNSSSLYFSKSFICFWSLKYSKSKPIIIFK